MKLHIEYDDFGEFLEMFDGENFIVVEDYPGGKTAELIMFEEGAA